MPPFLPRKRSTPPASPLPVPRKRARLADALDVDATNKIPSLKKAKTFSVGSDDSSSNSSLSDVDSDQFEDIDVHVSHNHELKTAMYQEDEAEDEDDVEWEDAEVSRPAECSTSHVPMANGPIQITLRKDDEGVIDYGTSGKAGSGKKGPSKREKYVRIMTHKLHVQFLLWHNAIRNSWIGDKKLQEILVKQLPAQITREVEKWKRSSGLVTLEPSKGTPAKGKNRRKTPVNHERSQRDWGRPSLRLEAGKPDMSHGDPLIMLMKVLSAYWKKRFSITAPGLRKRGYGTKHSLKQDIASLRNDEHDPERHGERIRNLAEFRKIAEIGQGSRDVGAQLFTALLRGLGIEARLVASLQPSGYGWTKNEQMLPGRPTQVVQIKDSSSDDDDIQPVRQKKTQHKAKSANRSQRSTRKLKVISLDTDDEGKTGENRSDTGGVDMTDTDSIVDVTPTMSKAQKARYDRDLMFPIYWTEAISPITNKVLAVSPLVVETPVALSEEILSLFEPRGAKADKSRQIMAYVVAYSSDGTVKDVTVRYLKKRIWPGRTKGSRLPLETIPIYDKTGRVKRYADYDWFKYILRPYTRDDDSRTAVDELEDSTDLVPQQPDNKISGEGIDTLQSLKTSAEFVLERFLRREEALKPGAEPVRTFASGKGDKTKQESVYLRADVERCLTAESWHKEGRRPKLGETPMKMVPVRAVTLTRKREAEEHERQHGEKQKQGLYSWDQTEYIIPPPIVDGVIPKNAYGNMDCFVPTMIPRGAVHVPLKGTVRICKKLEIDFAEAVTGFEFGNKRAVPVCTGVVIAQEHEKLVRDAWEEWNEQQRLKEEAKMEKLVLDMWRKFVLGLRIRERVQDMYGEDIGMVDDGPSGFSRDEAIAIDDDDDIEQGGVSIDDEQDDGEMGGGFLLPHEEHAAPMEELVMDDQQHQSQPHGEQNERGREPQLPSKGRYAPPYATKSSEADSLNDDRSQDMSDEDTYTLPRSSCIQTSHTSLKTHTLLPTNPRQYQDVPSPRHHTTGYVSARSMSQDDAISSDDKATSVMAATTTNRTDESATSEDDDSADDEENEEQEIYTPRPTRSRAIKPPHNTQQKAVQKQVSTLKSQAGRRSKRVPTSKLPNTPQTVETGDTSDGDDLSDHSARHLSYDRRKGKARTTRLTSKNTSTPKRSKRLLRMESTIFTSPYFEP